jgi:hypothetical protein
MARWLFVMEGGIEPGEVIGPYTSDEEQEALILQELRKNPELLWEDGTDSIHWIEIDGAGKPELGSFTCGFMDDLRAKVWAEREEEECKSPS